MLKKILIFSDLRKYQCLKKTINFDWLIKNSNNILLNTIFLCGIICGSYMPVFEIKSDSINLFSKFSSLFVLIIYITSLYIMSVIFGFSMIGAPFNTVLSFINGFFFSNLILAQITVIQDANLIIEIALIIPVYGIIATLTQYALSESQKLSFIIAKYIKLNRTLNISQTITNYIKYICILYFVSIILVFLTQIFIK